MSNNHASTDYEIIRDHLFEVLEQSKDALQLAKRILEESEHPRAVEVYSNLLANYTKLNAQILDLSKTYKDITSRSGYGDPGADGKQVEKQEKRYIGSTSDLQKALKQLDKLPDEIDLNPANDG